jgi:5-methyltetrahydropteroyltriglutamate--homocysteine methyltransferase
MGLGVDRSPAAGGRLPLFPVTTVGSWPRPEALLAAQKEKRAGRLAAAEFERVADQAVLAALRAQEEAGVDLVTDGEQRRDSFFSFVAEKLDGVALMTLAEMLAIVEDKAGFERILQTLDVPSYAISNATCVGRVRRARPLAADELAFLRRHTDRPIKVPLPGPYLMTRAMYVREACAGAYASKEALGDDVVAVLREEIGDLLAGGVDFIQFDEPVLTEIVFTQGQVRTFMCAALAAGKDPAEELAFAHSLMERVVEGFDFRAAGVRLGLHVCRGNWSRDESTLLRGSYAPLAATLAAMPVDQLVLEYATERAGEVMAIEGKELGLGVVNPRTDEIEDPAEIVAAVHEALRHYPPEAIFLNPDCGFATFSRRPVSAEATARAKLRAMVQAARELR